MKRYKKYKDSGIEWIGEIPHQWVVNRLKNMVSEPLKYGANESATESNPDNPRYIRITDFGNDGNLRNDSYKSLPLEKAEGYFLKEGDLLFARSGATVGKTFLFKNYDGEACFAGYLIKASFDKMEISSTYIDYFTRSNYYENWKQSVFQQATIQNIGADKYNQLRISIPKSITEQTQIANYLDRKTQQIDVLIEKKESLIALLEEEYTAIINQAVTKGLDPNVKMKDSEIDWLVEIPEDWDATKLRFLASIIPSNVDKKTKEGEKEVLLCNYTDVYKNDYIRYDPNFMKASASNAQIEKLSLKKHDVIVTKDSEDPNDIGVSALVLDNLEGVVCGYHLTVFRNEGQNEFGRFLFWFLKSKICSDYFATMARGITRYALGTNTFKELFVPMPKNEIEFDKISNFLENITTTIQTTINKANQEIDYLKEYKTTLISEVVTGKIDVRQEVLN